MKISKKTLINIKILKKIAKIYGFKDVKLNKSLPFHQWAKLNVLDPNKCVYLNPNFTYKEYRKYYSYKIKPSQLFLFTLLHEIGHYVLKHFYEEMSMPFYKNAKNHKDIHRNWVKLRKKQEKEAWQWAHRELTKYNKFK